MKNKDKVKHFQMLLSEREAAANKKIDICNKEIKKKDKACSDLVDTVAKQDILLYQRLIELEAALSSMATKEAENLKLRIEIARLKKLC